MFKPVIGNIDGIGYGLLFILDIPLILTIQYISSVGIFTEGSETKKILQF